MRSLIHLTRAMSRSEKGRPKLGGFPYLAECLRQEGFTKNTWYLPSGDSFYFSEEGSLVIPGKSLIDDISSSPDFSEKRIITALRVDQAGQTTFPEFLINIWKSGVVKYEVHFIDRYVVYYGAHGEEYREIYPQVEIAKFS